MAMKMTLNEFLGVDELSAPSPEVIEAKMTLEFQSDVFMRMKTLGMRQKDLAESLEVTPAAVSKLLRDGSNLRNSSIAKVAAALKCDVIPAKLIPIEDRSDKETSSTLSSGMTITTTIRREVSSPRIERTRELDPVDDEYRELCAQEKISETVNNPKAETLTGFGSFRMTGVAV